MYAKSLIYAFPFSEISVKFEISLSSNFIAGRKRKVTNYQGTTKTIKVTVNSLYSILLI